VSRPSELGVTSVAERGVQGEAQSAPAAQVSVPEPTPLALRYYRSGNVLWGIGTGLSLLIPVLLLYSATSARLRSFAFRVGRRWLPSLMLYALLFTAVTALLSLPLAYYEGFLRQHAYGLSNQSFEKWAGDWLKGVAISGALDSLLAPAAKSPKVVVVCGPGHGAFGSRRADHCSGMDRSSVQ
jgi:hypothetical protein